MDEQFGERLLEVEDKFRLLAENSQDVIYRYRVSPTRGYDYISPSVSTLVGYTSQECYDDPELSHKIVHPDDQHLLPRYSQSQGIPLSLRWIHKDGRVIWTETRCQQIHDAEGNLVAIEGITRDVTERKLVEEELERRVAELSRITAELERLSYSASQYLRASLPDKGDFSLHAWIEDYAAELGIESSALQRRIRRLIESEESS